MALACAVGMASASASEATAPRRGPNLCGANRVVIGVVEFKEPFARRAQTGAAEVYTTNAIRVERVIAGPSLTQDNLVTQGGAVGGVAVEVSDAPSFSPNTRQLLFLVDLEELTGRRLLPFEPAYLAHIPIPLSAPLPSETDLRQIWTELCATPVEGVYLLDPRGDDAAPDIVKRLHIHAGPTGDEPPDR